MRVILLLLVLGLLIAWYFYRQGLDKPKSKQDRRIESLPDSDYHAVSIKPGSYACSAVTEVAGKRFLASEAPDLPLSGCTAVKCECHFVHYRDRRSGKDRRSPFGSGGLAAASGEYAQERRQGEERRDEDDEFF
jgi:hypothetical protein